MPYVPLDDQFHSHRKVLRLLFDDTDEVGAA